MGLKRKRAPNHDDPPQNKAQACERYRRLQGRDASLDCIAGQIAAVIPCIAAETDAYVRSALAVENGAALPAMPAMPAWVSDVLIHVQKGREPKVPRTIAGSMAYLKSDHWLRYALAEPPFPFLTSAIELHRSRPRRDMDIIDLMRSFVAPLADSSVQVNEDALTWRDALINHTRLIMAYAEAFPPNRTGPKLDGVLRAFYVGIRHLVFEPNNIEPQAAGLVDLSIVGGIVEAQAGLEQRCHNIINRMRTTQ